jgi:hypothetical protein
MTLKCFTCTSFEGYWPVGSAAIVNACDRSHAARLLNASLKAIQLPGGVTAKDMIEFKPEDSVRILCDGNY